MSSIKIAEATFDDIPELCTLLGHLFEQESEFTSSQTLQRTGLEKIIKDKNKGRILIIKDKNEVIGMINLLFTISTALGGDVAIIEDMVIKPTKRGKGFGSRLISYAIEFAINNNCKRITLLTDTENTRAQKFYKYHGFNRSSMVVFRKNLNC